ncbi:MAG: L,D-transpeptidase family protein [Acidobacteriota bacterium]
MAAVGPAAESRLRAKFEAHGVAYPPRKVALLAFKEERRMEVWAEGDSGPRFIEVYRILATSGDAGPKLHEGDYQVPEGIYRVIWLNPNSSYHLSLELDYPNEFDRARAREDGRTNLGGDIFIHGDDVSVGCLAVGDRAAEDLFVLAARIGPENVEVLIAPWDLRHRPPPEKVEAPVRWLGQLYSQLEAELARFR